MKLWWIIQVALLLSSFCFMIFGIDILLGSYALKDPFSFIMSFFAASFVILISLALALSFAIKMIRMYQKKS